MGWEGEATWGYGNNELSEIEPLSFFVSPTLRSDPVKGETQFNTLQTC